MKNKRGFILIDALICIGIVEIMLILLINTLNLHFKIDETITNKINQYDYAIANAYKQASQEQQLQCQNIEKE